MTVIRGQNRVKMNALYPYAIPPQQQVIVFDVVPNKLYAAIAYPAYRLHHIVLVHILEILLDQRDEVGFSLLYRESNSEQCSLPGVFVIRLRVYGAHLRGPHEAFEFSYPIAVNHGT